MVETNKALPVINYIDFNQNGSCVSVGTSDGFKIFNCQPFGKFFNEKQVDSGGYSIVEMLFCTSLVALVGNGDFPHQSPRKLQLVNTKKQSTICEVTFPTSILSVRMNKSRLVILLKSHIYIYDITSMKLLHVIENILNPYGLMAVSSSLHNNILVYPCVSRVIDSEIKSDATTNNITIPFVGRENICNLTVSTLNEHHDKHSGTNNNNNNYTNSIGSNSNPNNKLELSAINSNNTANSNNLDSVVKNGDVIIFNLDTLQPLMVIEAHDNSIAAVGLSQDGTLLATASEKGTIIRIFSIETGNKIYQFRRGTYQTKVFSLTFSDDNSYLTVCCSSRTVHIFKLGAFSTNSSTNNLNNYNGNNDEQDEDREGSQEDETEDITNGSEEILMNTSDDDDNISLSGVVANGNKIREPYIDASRKTVARMIRNSSQNLTRKAAKTLGQLLPFKVNSILEPSRHFASIKLPVEANDKYIKSVASIGKLTELSTVDFPELAMPVDSEEMGTDQLNGNFKRPMRTPSSSSALSASTSTSTYANKRSDSQSRVKVLPIYVITTEGYMFHYVMDPERGGDCLLLAQHSLLLE